MAMYSIGILGSGLVGAPLAGTLADNMVGMSSTFLIITAIYVGTAAATAWSWLKHENRNSGRTIQR